MNNGDRMQLKERLRLLADAPAGLYFDTRELWIVSGIKQPKLFFQNLRLLMPSDSILYLEGTSIHPEAATLYAKHEASHPTPLDCGTIFPIPDFYHLDFSAEIVAGMLDLIACRPVCELFLHANGYRAKSLIFSFHDAFESNLCVSGNIAESTVGEFCSALGVSYSRKATPKRTNSYRDLLYLMEHPEKVKIPRAPWWREFLDGFKSGFHK